MHEMRLVLYAVISHCTVIAVFADRKKAEEKARRVRHANGSIARVIRLVENDEETEGEKA